jgi:predicted enzyme involved in methoxymalonyl-ACP biosynthesis
LLKRKLVVCDLDNTLWRGVIGEGAVQHHADRQHTLKALRQRGVVLSVASKNDPKNVHFRGAVLSEDDFVDSQINWDMNEHEALGLQIQDLGRARDGLGLGRTARIIGQHRETASNQPSTRVYPDNGFVFDGTAWVHEAREATPLTDPAWLTIQTG